MQGECSLPSREEMWKDIQLKQEMMAQRFFKSTSHTIQVDWLPYLDEMAELVGCKPDIGEEKIKE